MRISKTLMTGAVAAVVVAGSANAAVVYNFGLTFNTPNPTSNSGGNSFKTSSGSASGLWDSYLATAAMIGSDVIASPGSMQFAVGTNNLASAGMQLESVAGANLLGVTDFNFNVTAYTGGPTDWEILVGDIDGRQVGTSALVSISGTGQKTFAVSGFTNYVGTGFDWSKVTYINVAAYTTGTAASFTFDSWTASIVPAPGALALLGAAGLAGRRRRS
jgi:hypothetical protein